MKGLDAAAAAKSLQSSPTLCDPIDSSPPGSPTPGILQARMLEWAIQPSHPLSSPSPPAFNLSQHQGFSNESVLPIRWPKYWSVSISPSNEYSGLISFRIDWFDLRVVQGTLKSLLQHPLQCSCLENPRDGGAWWAAVYGVAQSPT